jgi:hypothetical protein
MTTPRRSPATRVAAPTLRLPLPPTLRPHCPGEFLGLIARDHRVLFRRMAAAGDLTQIRLGRERLVLLNHPNHIKQLLVTDQRSFIKGRALDQLKPLLGEGLLTREGETSTCTTRSCASPAAPSSATSPEECPWSQ